MVSAATGSDHHVVSAATRPFHPRSPVQSVPLKVQHLLRTTLSHEAMRDTNTWELKLGVLQNSVSLDPSSTLPM